MKVVLRVTRDQIRGKVRQIHTGEFVLSWYELNPAKYTYWDTLSDIEKKLFNENQRAILEKKHYMQQSERQFTVESFEDFDRIEK